MKLSTIYYISFFIFLFNFQLIAQNKLEENKRFFKLINLKNKVNKGFFESNKQITKLLFEGAKNGNLPIYKVEYKDDDTKKVEVERLQTDYMDKFQTLTTDQLSILGIDYVESTINSTKNIHIQYLHLFVSGDYFSDSKPQFVVAFRYEDAKRFLDNDHRTVWISTKNENSTSTNFFENLFLADENEQAQISQKLAQLVKSGSITPYDLENFEYKKKEKGKKKEPKEIQKMNAEQFLNRWNSLTDAPVGEIRIQNIDNRIANKDSHDFFTSKWITIWNTKSDYLKPVASFKVEEIKPFFQNEESKNTNQKVVTYTQALQNTYFETQSTVWQNDNLKDEPFYKDNSSFENSSNPSLNQLAYYIRTEIYLNENVNKSLFQNNNEISKLLLRAVENGKLKAYQADYNQERGNFYEKQIDFEEIKTNLLKPTKEKSPAEILNSSEEQIQLGISLDQVAELENFRNQQAKQILETNQLYTNPSNRFFYMSDISLLEIENELIYDTEKERYFYQSAYISLYIPAEKSGIELNKLVAKFKMQDVLKLLMKSPKIKLSDYQKQFIYQNYEAEKKIPKQVSYAYFLCKQLYVGNKWLVEGVFWE